MGKCTCQVWTRRMGEIKHCVDPFHAFNVIHTFKVTLNIQPVDVRLYYHYHRDSVFVMHFSHWFSTESFRLK